MPTSNPAFLKKNQNKNISLGLNDPSFRWCFGFGLRICWLVVTGGICNPALRSEVLVRGEKEPTEEINELKFTKWAEVYKMSWSLQWAEVYNELRWGELKFYNKPDEDT